MQTFMSEWCDRWPFTRTNRNGDGKIYMHMKTFRRLLESIQFSSDRLVVACLVQLSISVLQIFRSQWWLHSSCCMAFNLFLQLLNLKYQICQNSSAFIIYASTINVSLTVEWKQILFSMKNDVHCVRHDKFISVALVFNSKFPIDIFTKFECLIWL